MDRTEQNVKMLEKAEEIEREWVPSVGDVFAHKYDDGRRVVEGNPIYEAGIGSPVAKEGDLLPLAVNWEKRQDRYIWLPTQCQLQEMIDWGAFNSPANKTKRFYTWVCDTASYDYLFYFVSMEQLWLAFVMKEKHNKVWNGDNWIKSGS